MKIMLVCFQYLSHFVRLWTSTENYECYYIKQLKINKLEEQIFWYKASAHNDFKLGAKEFWEMSKNLEAMMKKKHKTRKQ